MKISIITASYNSALTITDTLESVKAQNYKDVEPIVFDGASNDGTVEILKNHAQNLTYWKSEPDKGIYDALNKGIALATGDIIGFLNADDVYAHRDVLAHVANAIESENLDAVYADITFFDQKQPGKVLRRYSSKGFSPDRIAWGWMPAHPSLYMRSEVYHRLGPFKTDYKIAGDYEYVARSFGTNKLRYKYIPEVFVRMRIGGVSTGGWRNTILLNQEVIRACRENGLATNTLKIMSKYPMKLLELVSK
jgi:glycosyltransferase involved in cell wall biosynthesis